MLRKFLSIFPIEKGITLFYIKIRKTDVLHDALHMFACYCNFCRISEIEDFEIELVLNLGAHLKDCKALFFISILKALRTDELFETMYIFHINVIFAELLKSKKL